MKIPRRRFLHLAAGAVALPAVSRTARAQAYARNKIKHFYEGLRSLETVMPTKSAAALILVLGLLVAGLPLHAAPATQYEEVKDWPKLPAGVELGEVAGVAVDVSGHVFIFHRPGRGFDLTATEKIKEPTVLEIDADTGTLIASWGANTFLVPHGITIDGSNNVFVTDVSLQQVLKFTHDGKPLLALGEPRVGAWDATHFNQPTDIAIHPDGSFYVSDGYVNSRVAYFDPAGKHLYEWGKKGAGEGEFSNPRPDVYSGQHGRAGC
jgi:peptidylamidoglycolate lyase